MAVYEHLPIFKRLMDLTVFVEQMVSHFSRYYKYTLGSALRGMCHEALGLVVDANSARTAPGKRENPQLPPFSKESAGFSPGEPSSNLERREVLLKLRTLLERIKIHLMIAREVKAFNNKNSFVQATEMVADLCRQNEGWLKSAVSGGPIRNS